MMCYKILLLRENIPGNQIGTKKIHSWIILGTKNKQVQNVLGNYNCELSMDMRTLNVFGGEKHYLIHGNSESTLLLDTHKHFVAVVSVCVIFPLVEVITLSPRSLTCH